MNQKEKKHNLHIWQEVEVTNPSWLKDANIAGNKIKSINPQKQMRQATELFGPYGATWGLQDYTLELISLEDTVKLWLLKGFFFFPEGRFPVSNTIKFCYTSKAGKYIVDDEATKKIETNTISKALSRLGFSSDVYEGNFDNVPGYEKMVDYLIGLTAVEIGSAKKAIKQQTEAMKLIALWNRKKAWHDNKELVEFYQEELQTLQQLDN